MTGTYYWERWRHTSVSARSCPACYFLSESSEPYLMTETTLNLR